MADFRHPIMAEGGACLLTETDDDVACHTMSEALAFDAEDYNAVLITMPNFGCVQFEPRQEG